MALKLSIEFTRSFTDKELAREIKDYDGNVADAVHALIDSWLDDWHPDTHDDEVKVDLEIPKKAILFSGYIEELEAKDFRG